MRLSYIQLVPGFALRHPTLGEMTSFMSEKPTNMWGCMKVHGLVTSLLTSQGLNKPGGSHSGWILIHTSPQSHN